MKTGTPNHLEREELCSVYALNDSRGRLVFLRFGWSVGMCIADADSGAVAMTDNQGVVMRTRYLIV